MARRTQVILRERGCGAVRRTRERSRVEAPELGVKVFCFHAPCVRNRPLTGAADGPTGVGASHRRGSKGDAWGTKIKGLRVALVGKRRTAGRVDEQTIKGGAKTSASGCQPVRIHRIGDCQRANGGNAGRSQSPILRERVEITLDTDQPVSSNLIIIADLAAARERAMAIERSRTKRIRQRDVG